MVVLGRAERRLAVAGQLLRCDDYAVGQPYEVTSSSDVTVDRVTLDSPDATLRIDGGRFSAPGGIDVNEGQRRLTLGTLANTRLSGSGEVVAIRNSSIDEFTFENVMLATTLGGPSSFHRLRLPTGLQLDNGAVHSSGIDLRLIGDAGITGVGEILVTPDAFNCCSPDAWLYIVLDIELGGGVPGVEHDRLDVADAQLGGTLRLLLSGGFTPSGGDSFTVVSASGQLSGGFDAVVAPWLASNQTLHVEQTATSVTVSIVEQVTADFDSDGDVDGRDLLAWQRTVGSTATPAGTGADADGNGVVDGADLGPWQEEFGANSGSNAAPSTTAVPEPDCLIFALPAAICLVAALRRAFALAAH